MNKKQAIIAVLAWNLNWDEYDHETGEEQLIEWILDTAKYLEGQDINFLLAHLFQNSLHEEVDANL